MTKLFNLHTHHPLPPDEETIRTCGIHPWRVTPNWQRKFNLCFGPLNFPFSSAPQLLHAIGECGLDSLCDVPMELQEAAFRAQVGESELRCIPMIIHCVKQTQQLLDIHRTATQTWVWHGFRGKPQQMQQLLQHGFYISFGMHYNSDSLAACPHDRLFLETDDIQTSIRPLYEQVAQLRSTTLEVLSQQVWDNAKRLFFK